MKFPMMVITYGAFGADQKKLYIYEKDGIPLFPVFNDPVVAAQFQASHQKLIKQNGDDRLLTIQVCSKPQFMRDILIVISSIARDVTTVIFDPSPIDGFSEEAIKAGVKPQDRHQSFEDAIQELEGLSMNAVKSSEHSK